MKQAERGGKLLRSLMAYFPPTLALENSPRKGKRNVLCTVNVNEQEADKWRGGDGKGGGGGRLGETKGNSGRRRVPGFLPWKNRNGESGRTDEED